MNTQKITEAMQAAGYTEVECQERRIFVRAGNAGGIAEVQAVDVVLKPARLLKDGQWPAVAAAEQIQLAIGGIQETHDALFLRACRMPADESARKETAKK